VPTCLFVGTLVAVIVIGTIRTIAAHGHPLPIVRAASLAGKRGDAFAMGFSKGIRKRLHRNDARRAVSNGIMAFRNPNRKCRRTLTSSSFC